MFNEVMSKIKGPVFPIITAFDEERNVDYAATNKYIDFLCEGGARVVYLMAHSSRLGLLTTEEVIRLNESVCSYVKNNWPGVLVIGATPMYGGLQTAIETAVRAEKAGADLISVIFTERYYYDIQVYDFFKSISSKVSCGILIHEEPLNSIHGSVKMNWPLDLINKITDIENVIAIKEDAKDSMYTYKVSNLLKNKVSIIVSGGSKEQFMWESPSGCHAYLVGLGSIDPQISLKFYNCFNNNDPSGCFNIINKYEEPFFKVTKTIGWHIGLKSAMEHMGLMMKYERRPLVEVSSKHHEEIFTMLCNIGYLNNR